MLKYVISLVQFINNLSQKKAEIAFPREVGLDERAPRPPTGQVALAINFPHAHAKKNSSYAPYRYYGVAVECIITDTEGTSNSSALIGCLIFNVYFSRESFFASATMLCHGKRPSSCCSKIR